MPMGDNSNYELRIMDYELRIPIVLAVSGKIQCPDSVILYLILGIKNHNFSNTFIIHHS